MSQLRKTLVDLMKIDYDYANGLPRGKIFVGIFVRSYSSKDLRIKCAAMAEWLRRLTRNQMGLPAQVQILFAAIFLCPFKIS